MDVWVPLDILEVCVKLLLPFLFVLLHELEILTHLGKLLAKELGSLTVLLYGRFLTHSFGFLNMQVI